jgi:hypothetical protein
MNEIIRFIGASCFILLIYTVLSSISGEVGKALGYEVEYNRIDVVGAFVCGCMTAFLYRNPRVERKGG